MHSKRLDEISHSSRPIIALKVNSAFEGNSYGVGNDLESACRIED